MRSLRWIGLVLVLFLLWSGSTAADTSPLTMDEMVRTADGVVLGRVLESSSRWDGGRIVTDYRLDVHLSTPGLPSPLVVTVEGGRIGTLSMGATEVPHLRKGEDVLLFLTRWRGEWRVWGGPRGHFRLMDGWAMQEGTGQVVTVRSLLRRVARRDVTSAGPLLPAGWEARAPTPSLYPPRSLKPENFTYDGYHWAGSNPMGEPYLVNTNASKVDPAAFLQAVRNAASNWTNVSCSYFVFTYGGTTALANDTSQVDGYNIVSWGPLEAGVLGRTTYWFWSNKVIFEADMVLNTAYNWATGDTIPPDSFDVESVALHEFGHFLSLGHDDNPAAVMYPSLAPGGRKRWLYTTDIDGICTIYPKNNPTPTPTSTFTPTPLPASTPTPTPTPSPILATSTPTPTPTFTPTPTLASSLTPSPTPTPTPCYRTITGVVFQDDNNNGVMDAGEAGMAGLAVHLQGPITSAVVTLSSGRYWFVGMPSGTYTISVELPVDWGPTSPNPRSVDMPTDKCALISDVDFGLAPATPTPTATPTQSPIPNTPTPTPTPTSTYTPTYTPTLTPTPTFTPTPTLTPTFTPTPTPTPYPVTDTPTPTPTPTTGTIEGYVWQDEDMDGVQDEGEAGLAGMTVMLLPPGLLRQRNEGVYETVTDEQGHYRIDGVAPGLYTLSVTYPGGAIATTVQEVQLVPQAGVTLSVNFGFYVLRRHWYLPGVWQVR